MIDTSVQLNNHNSYHATEDYWCTLYGVQTQKYVTVSFAVYATSTQSAKNLVKLRFYTEAGAIAGESSHMFAVDTIWDRVSVTVQVPTTAKNMQICFLSGSYWWAEPKAEGGEIATAYSTNTAGTLTWMTANGIYTGTVTASQVILSNNDPLDNRLATLNNSMLKLSSDISGTNASITEIKAGQAVFVKASDLANAGKTTINGSNITTGTITGVSLNIGSGTFKVTSGGALTATSADISGTVTASSGTIGGWVINPSSLTIGSGSNSVSLMSGTSDTAIRVGGTSYDAAPFVVMKNGFVKASNVSVSGSVTITSGSINIGSSFSVSNAGKLTATSADISGKITATSGSIKDLSCTNLTISGSTYSGKVTSNSSSSIGGTLNYTDGYLSSVGGSYNGSINSSGYFGGSLSSAGGSFYGSTYSSSGTLGGVSFNAYSSTALRFNGKLFAVAITLDDFILANKFYETSDVRLKENISPLTVKRATNLIEKVKPIEYKLKNSDGNHYGVLAQDLIQDLDADTAEIFVKPTSEGYFSVDYTSLQMATIPVIQDLLKRVERLENAGTSNL